MWEPSRKHLCTDLLKAFYLCTTESILTACMTACYPNCPDCLQRVSKTSQKIIGLWTTSSQLLKGSWKASAIFKGDVHPSNHRFTLLLFGRRCRAIEARTPRLKIIYFFPPAITELKQIHPSPCAALPLPFNECLPAQRSQRAHQFNVQEFTSAKIGRDSKVGRRDVSNPTMWSQIGVDHVIFKASQSGGKDDVKLSCPYVHIVMCRLACGTV